MQQLLLAIVFAFLLFTPISQAQTWLERMENYKIKPIFSIQSWATFSHGMEVFDPENQRYVEVDDRLNFEVRRLRFGAKGQPYPNLRFVLVGAIDFIGRDVLSAMQGGVSNGNLPVLGIWNAYTIWRVKDGNEGLNVFLGYFPTPFGRASISSATNAPSFEQAWAQNYVRRHLVGRGPGRTVGLALGGVILNEAMNRGLHYTLGIYNPNYFSNDGNSAGSQYAPLLAARTVLYLGDPEQKQYNPGHKTNYFNKRKGFSLGLAAAYQDETTLYEGNGGLSVDWLFNWNGWNIDGEWSRLFRRGQRPVNGALREFTNRSWVGYFRMSHNFMVNDKYILEPAIMVMQFSGAMDEEGQLDAADVGAFAGEDRMIDIGLNWHLNPGQVKFSLHYVLQSGDSGNQGDGATFNNYFFRGGVGAVQRGNYVGAEAIFVF